MGYYDWEAILKTKSDKELNELYNDRRYEPKDKINAMTKELVARGLLSSEGSMVEKVEESPIYNLEEITNTKPNKKRAQLTMFFISIILLIDIVTIYSLKLQYDLLKSVKNGVELTNEMAANSDLRGQVIAYFNIGMYIITSIMFLMWFERAYRNLGKRIKKLEFDEGWSVGSWFVPIVSLFRPYNIMTELDKKTKMILQYRNIKSGELESQLIIGLWWISWILIQNLGWVYLKLSSKTETIDDFINNTKGDIIVSILHIVLAFVTILMIYNFSNKEELLYISEKEK